MEEVWKDVVGYEGLYQVSNLGHIRSLDHYVAHHTAGMALRKGRVLKPAFDGHYLSIGLSKDNKAKSTRIHRIVAEAFLPNPDKLSDVDHIDCDKTNNRVDNLRWCSHADNMHFAKENHCMRSIPYAERSEWYRERSAAARRKPVIRSDGKWYKSTTDAAKDLGVSRGAVSHVLCGLTERCQGYSFSYA